MLQDKRKRYILFISLLPFFNAFDAFSTVYALKYLGATELNPIALSVYNISPLLFIFFKLLLSVVIFSAMLYNKEAIKKFFYGLFIGMTIIYALLFTYQVVMLLRH